MFDLGALLALVAQKPEMAAQLDSLGIPPPNPQMMKLGAAPPPGGGIGSDQIASPAVSAPPPQIPPFDTTVNPAAEGSPDQGGIAPQSGGSAGASPNNQMLQNLAALKGIVPPTAPQPVMGGGVTGGVKPPEAKAVAANSAPGALGALLAAALQHDQNPLRVPQLGHLMR